MSNDIIIEIYGRDLYEEILKIVFEVRLIRCYSLETKAIINIKYKIVAKKVKPMKTQVPLDSKDHIKKAKKEPKLKETRRIEYNFIEETLAKLKIERSEFLKES